MCVDDLFHILSFCDTLMDPWNVCVYVCILYAFSTSLAHYMPQLTSVNIYQI